MMLHWTVAIGKHWARISFFFAVGTHSNEWRSRVFSCRSKLGPMPLNNETKWEFLVQRHDFNARSHHLFSLGTVYSWLWIAWLNAHKYRALVLALLKCRRKWTFTDVCVCFLDCRVYDHMLVCLEQQLSGCYSALSTGDEGYSLQAGTWCMNPQSPFLNRKKPTEFCSQDSWIFRHRTFLTIEI